eukprot:4274762-Pyramimonas_sp.AAC.1
MSPTRSKKNTAVAPPAFEESPVLQSMSLKNPRLAKKMSAITSVAGRTNDNGLSVNLPTGAVNLPTGAVSLPTGAVSLPTGA